MIIGTFKELKKGESRVVLTPVEVEQLISEGHQVIIGKDAGVQAGFSNEAYRLAGAEIVGSYKDVYERSELIVKVKEILPEEYELMKENQMIFTCLHPAANEEEVNALIKKKVIAFTAEDTHQYGSPNSEAAGKVGALMGIQYLLKHNGGMGKLVGGLGGAPGINALVIGGGIVGKSVINILSSLGAHVTMMDINISTLREAQYLFNGNVTTLFSNQSNIRKILSDMDLVINCVKWPKHRTDHLITRDMVKSMQERSVIVDISADVGGAIETYRPTTFEQPTYIEEGVLHFGVDNIPGTAPHTTSIAYAASVFPHIQAIANLGYIEACKRNPYLRRSLTTYKGLLTHEETSMVQQRDYKTPEEVLGFEGLNLTNAPKAF
ncbi:alanine dehydrogenase [Bacillus tianshenii]|nr:alanine dehydrogenase [Bacillus tianshenii]